jgi:uroporphyrin-III C-methyltransferase
VAIVQNATRPDQREAVTTLGDLDKTVAREGLGSPAVIVVGDVIKGVAAIAQAPRQASASR